MDAQPFYSQMQVKLCQGDILERVPLIHSKVLPRTLRKVTLQGNREGAEFGSTLGAEPLSSTEAKLQVCADCDHTRAILLTHDCEIDKPNTKYLTVALVRPLAPLLDPQKELIRENRNFAFFHLPSLGDSDEENYVDFRRLATLSVDIVTGAKRLASLSDMAWKAMLVQLVRFLTRLEIKAEGLDRPS